MPGQLRTRLRRALTGQAEGGPLSKIKSRQSKNCDPDDDYYKPGEKMPPLKYRRAVDPEHKKRLEAFSFSTAWRARSRTSLYSPMGSRLPSRRGSCRSRRSRSRSMARSRRSSFSTASDYDAEEWVDSGIGASIAGDERPANIREASDDEGDVLNVGLSRNPTEDPRDAKNRKQSTGHRRSSSTKLASRPGTGSDHTRRPSQPFSPEDLELALQRSHLEATREESDKSCASTPSDDYDDPSPFLRPRGGSIYVPYDGQGTPPKLPFWGSAYPGDDNDAPMQFPRRESIFVSNEESCSPTYERRQSVFLAAEGITAARRPSILPPAEDPCECTPQEQTKRKPQPCCPSDAIAAILARKDL
ncbi:hypothetical protein FB567DRAFT_118769 [Paraphoma chrysanthemicola]|uniref:Uncharacterized protein n=1 Tax=Paraphoma chrysanthemicola TaxID=798071 RepID=A0A8K0R088_9PLEO|nr:hypothetical protein FB567DRAFT_118769 [Paraphoma chrysanthemicola]